MIRRVCVFCGSSRGARECYVDAAGTLARCLSNRGLGIVYGGSNCGLMTVVADTALSAGCEVIGVIPASMVEKEVAHPGLSDCAS